MLLLRHQLEKAELLGHLRAPTDAQKSDWATRTHVVGKKDDPLMAGGSAISDRSTE